MEEDQFLALKQAMARNFFLPFCEKQYRESNKGDRYWVLRAIKICADSQLTLPNWSAQAYIEGYDIVCKHKAMSWDFAFGHPHPKGMHSNALKNRDEKGFEVWKEINSILIKNQDIPIDEALFEQVGKKFGLGKTLTSDYYYFWKAAMSINLWGDDQYL